ncbi:winged helix-turn-helix transcriptional regulator [Mycolicibacterium thermoresistibile]
MSACSRRWLPRLSGGQSGAGKSSVCIRRLSRPRPWWNCLIERRQEKRLPRRDHCAAFDHAAAPRSAVGDRWSALIIRELFYGSRRFDEFQQRLGVATNILSQRLQRLVDHAVVGRSVVVDQPAPGATDPSRLRQTPRPPSQLQRLRPPLAAYRGDL